MARTIREIVHEQMQMQMQPLKLQPDYGSSEGAAVPRGEDRQKQAFNKENGPELLGQLLRVLKSNGMDDALQAIKSCGLTRKLNDEWMGDTRNRQKRKRDRRAAERVDPEMLKAWKRHVLRNQRRWGRHDADDWLDEAISYGEEYWKAMNLDPGDDVPMREVEQWAEKQAPGLIAFAQFTDLMPKMAKEHASEKALKKYFKDHPNMTDEQKSKHTVKEEGSGGAVGDLTSAASAMLDKMPDDVQRFVKDKKHRDEVLTQVADDLRENAPKYVKEVKKGLGPEVKAAVEGVEALSKGDSPSSDQKKAMRNLAVEVTAAVSTKGVPGAAALIGMKVLKHIAVTALNAVLGTHFGQQPATAKVAALGEDQFIAELLVAVGDELGKGISEKDLIDSLNSAPEKKKASARRVATAYQIKTGKRKEVPRRPFRHPGGQKHRLDPEGRPGARPPDTWDDVVPGRGSDQYIRAVKRMLQKKTPDQKILRSLTTKWRLSPRDAQRELDRIKGQLRLAKKVYSLRDFQTAAFEADRAVGNAVNATIHLKEMWDSFEEIPPKQQPLYDLNLKTMYQLSKPRGYANNVYEKLKRYR